MAEIVTSENLQEFNLSRVRFPTLEPVAEKPAESEPRGEVVAEAVEVEAKPESEHADPKKAHKPIQERFSELTSQRKAAELRAEAAERRASELEARIQAKEAPIVVAPDPDAKPDPKQFTDAFEYAEKLSQWSAKEAIRQDRAEQAQAKERERTASMQTEWNKRLAEARAEIPDYDEVMIGSQLSVSDQVRDAIRESDVGPKLAYHLAANPETAEKINGMTVIGALRAIGRLEAQLEKPAETPKPTPLKAVVRPPAPITPIRAPSVPDDPLSSDGEFTGSFQQWKALRKAKRIG